MSKVPPQSALAFHKGSQVQALAQHTPYQSSTASSETDDQITPAELTRQPSRDFGDRQDAVPSLNQRLRHNSSILCVVVNEDTLYAGTQGGEILVYALGTFQRKATIEGHKGSVLGLFLSRDGELLFSSAGDRIVNVWSTSDLSRQYTLHSSYDVGDIFCIVYSSILRTAYIGSQNTTIQWCSLPRKGSKAHARPQASLNGSHSSFFDSLDPTGVRTPRANDLEPAPRHASGGESVAIGKENVRHFAHFGYVYCMQLVNDGIPESAGQEVLITGGGDGLVKLWKLGEGRHGAPEELYQLDDGREEGHSILAIAVDGTFLYSGRSGGEIDVWDLETRQLVRNLKAHRDDVLTLAIGGGFLFSAGVTGYVRKFDKQYGLKARLKAHEGRVLTSAFTYHHRRPLFVTGGSDCTLAIWDISDCVSPNTAAARTSNEQLIDCLRRFVSYRTVSSDPRYMMECRKGASYLRSVFKNFGAATEMLPTSDPHNPVILARFRGNPATAVKRKKILFYGHYDVVAAENTAGKWLTDPFVMEGIDGYLYGRGTSDNKGPVLAAIFACAELIGDQALGSDIVFLIEGEEECGSRGFEKAVNAAKSSIGDIDWILLANSYWLDDRIPCLTYGLRGVIHATVQIESSHPDLHSGVDGSSQLDESLKDLVMLLATLTGRDGKVNIPGFYDPIPDLTAGESELYRDITAALIQRNPNLGHPNQLAASLMHRWRDPSLTIHRFQTSGPDNATIIPRLAKVALSMRLVPNQDAVKVAAALTRHMQSEFARLGSNNKLTITIDHLAEPWLGDWKNEIFKSLEEAIMEVWGPLDARRRWSSPLTPVGEETVPSRKPSEIEDHAVHDAITDTNDAHHGMQTAVQHPRKPLYIREGGSIPAIRFLEKAFGAPAAHFPCGQASDSAHLDNERLRLANLYNSKEIFKRVFRDLPCK
ncbi:hypothetical protein BAUCODRAFT_62821 [Baudoinia panamericana UAMH 10762]|uniref:Peptidase M20 dimerisation domain-containing protein n=1 Tax=Baudoinia panamericana (strain UAMH 10762) TaxID=717646 RepID=M2N6B7_BAUPA|nr:uncharacterized protein BAUCODRAFT_62821 [Baudoinia panamericana UAMH 10762]EMC99603.1 hypothetical protein BAUCODRAFT_62821 [Baudoinia panamericana UAMH 10762]